MWVKVKGHMGQGWPKAYDIGRWAHINIKLHFSITVTTVGYCWTREIP